MPHAAADPAAIDRAMAAVDTDFEHTVARLADLVRIPSCSFTGSDPRHLGEAAEATADWLRAIGFPEVDLLRGDWPPYVLARDHRAGADAPTVLLYAHYDVQPPGRAELWTSPAYEPTARDGRLYGRGAGDDKAGIAANLAACAAWLQQDGRCPCNVTVWIEGEEEIGSPHLESFVARHLDALRCDAIVIADLGNVQTGVPTLTASLRGMVSCFVTLRALRGPLHSGMWGGPAPDPVVALTRMLGAMTDADGRIDWPGITIPAPDPGALADLERVPFDREGFATSMGVVAAGRARLTSGPECYRRAWYEPVFSINAIHAGGDRGSAGNIICDHAWARISLRTVPGMDVAATQVAMETRLRELAPDDMELTIEPEQQAQAWSTATDHPHFATCRAAFARGYEREPVTVGCGGTIPFVGALSERLGGVPALLVPVEDPDTRPHAEDESVHLGDLQRTTRSLAAFLGMIGA